MIQGSILEAEADVIVNAANSHGIMGGGVAGVIKRAAGQDVEDQARAQAPIAVGQAVLTSAGKTKFKGIIHAPTRAFDSPLHISASMKGGDRAVLPCAHRTSTVSSCAFCEQEG